jgi:hypothetical protein
VRLTKDDRDTLRALLAPFDASRAVSGYVADPSPVVALVPERQRVPVVTVAEPDYPHRAGEWMQSDEGRDFASANGYRRWEVFPTYRKAGK